MLAWQPFKADINIRLTTLNYFFVVSQKEFYLLRLKYIGQGPTGDKWLVCQMNIPFVRLFYRQGIKEINNSLWILVASYLGYAPIYLTHFILFYDIKNLNETLIIYDESSNVGNVYFKTMLKKLLLHKLFANVLFILFTRIFLRTKINLFFFISYHKNILQIIVNVESQNIEMITYS